MIISHFNSKTLALFLCITIFNFSKGQITGTSYGGSVFGSGEIFTNHWEYVGTTGNLNCDDGNILTTDSYHNGFCFNSDSTNNGYIEVGGGNVHALTTNNHIWSYDWFTNSVVHFNGTNWESFSYFDISNQFQINDFFQIGGSDTMYFSNVTPSGLDTFYMHDGTNLTKFHAANSILGNSIYDFRVVNDRCFILTDAGFHSLDGSGLQTEPLSTTFSISSYNNLLLGDFYQDEIMLILNGNTGTQGLLYYSGGLWVNFNEINSSLSSNNIEEVRTKSNGEFWISTNQGLDYFDGVTWINYNSSNSNLLSNSGNNLFISPNDELWVVNGIDIQHFNGSTWQNYQLAAGVNIQKVKFDLNNNPIFGSYGNFQGTITYIANSALNEISFPSANFYFNTMDVDEKNKLWIDNGYEVEVYDLPSLQKLFTYENIQNTLSAGLFVKSDVVLAVCTTDVGVGATAPYGIFHLIDNVFDSIPFLFDDEYLLSANDVAPLDVSSNDVFTTGNANQITNLSIIQGPHNGTAMVLSPSDPIIFTPNLNFVGADSFQYAYCQYNSQVFCDTAWVHLDFSLQDSLDAVNDLILVNLNDSAILDFLSNDAYDSLNYSFDYLSGPFHGSLTAPYSNTPSYYATTPFIGQDSIAYILCSDSAQSFCDTALILIELNLNPLAAFPDSVLVTLGTSNTINPTLNDSLFGGPVSAEITSPPTYGSGSFNANNVFTYSPSSIYPGLDTIYYRICHQNIPSYCDTSFIVFYIDSFPSDSIWPGDVNLDGVVDAWDILPVGTAFGSSGPIRLNGSTLWMAQSCLDWQDDFNNNVNYKHGDCDGNGLIDSVDVDVINLNYGLSSSKESGQKSVDGIPLFFEFPEQTYTAGSLVTGAIHVGIVDTPALDFYGIAFSINYDNTIIKDGSMEISFTNSWVSPSNSIIDISKDFWMNNQVDYGLCKTNQLASSGYGPIATVSFEIEENIANDITRNLALSFNNVLAIDKDQGILEIDTKSDTIELTQSIQSTYLRDEYPVVKLYPNPAKDILNIQSTEKIESMLIQNILGQCIYDNRIVLTDHFNLDIAKLKSGIYLLNILTHNKHSKVISFVKE